MHIVGSESSRNCSRQYPYMILENVSAEWKQTVFNMYIRLATSNI